MLEVARHYVFLGEELASEVFDYVVVGAGSAGCAVASRLTEDAGIG
jgi:choline dehydrogenase-like flavoprotein